MKWLIYNRNLSFAGKCLKIKISCNQTCVISESFVQYNSVFREFLQNQKLLSFYMNCHISSRPEKIFSESQNTLSERLYIVELPSI